jgi:predicted small lipoprotein YifL
MNATMKTFRLSMVILATALALGGCGRKNLPVAPKPVTAPITGSNGTTTSLTPVPTASGEAATFQRAQRLGANDSNLNVSPAEVSRNPKAEKQSFPLDFLLN